MSGLLFSADGIRYSLRPGYGSILTRHNPETTKRWYEALMAAEIKKRIEDV